MKYTEAMACGAMVLADEPEDFTKQRFKQGEHLILYNDLDDMKRKLLYYLKHNKERNAIAASGMKFVRKNHSCAMRVREFTKIVKKELGV
jgi:spore maturation protein CgeB